MLLPSEVQFAPFPQKYSNDPVFSRLYNPASPGWFAPATTSNPRVLQTRRAEQDQIFSVILNNLRESVKNDEKEFEIEKQKNPSLQIGGVWPPAPLKLTMAAIDNTTAKLKEFFDSEIPSRVAVIRSNVESLYGPNVFWNQTQDIPDRENFFYATGEKQDPLTKKKYSYAIIETTRPDKPSFYRAKNPELGKKICLQLQQSSDVVTDPGIRRRLWLSPLYYQCIVISTKTPQELKSSIDARTTYEISARKRRTDEEVAKANLLNTYGEAISKWYNDVFQKEIESITAKYNADKKAYLDKKNDVEAAKLLAEAEKARVEADALLAKKAELEKERKLQAAALAEKKAQELTKIAETKTALAEAKKPTGGGAGVLLALAAGAALIAAGQ